MVVTTSGLVAGNRLTVNPSCACLLAPCGFGPVGLQNPFLMLCASWPVFHCCLVASPRAPLKRRLWSTSARRVLSSRACVSFAHMLTDLRNIRLLPALGRWRKRIIEAVTKVVPRNWTKLRCHDVALSRQIQKTGKISAKCVVASLLSLVVGAPLLSCRSFILSSMAVSAQFYDSSGSSVAVLCQHGLFQCPGSLGSV